MDRLQGVTAMKHLTITLLFGILLNGAYGAKAADSNIETLMHLSGLSYRIDTLPARIQTAMHQNSPDYRGSGASVPHTALNDFHQQAKDYLTAALDENTQYALTDWLKTPLGEKTTRLESRHISLNILRALVENREKLLSDTGRLQMIVQLERIISATDAVVDNKLMARKIQLQARHEADRQTIEAAIRAARDDVYRYYYPLVIIQMSYTYHPLTDSQLQDYIDFAESPAGQYYHQSIAVLMQDFIYQAISLHTSGEARALYSARF